MQCAKILNETPSDNGIRTGMISITGNPVYIGLRDFIFTHLEVIGHYTHTHTSSSLVFPKIIII